jgi:hypothetical protein
MKLLPIEPRDARQPDPHAAQNNANRELIQDTVHGCITTWYRLADYPRLPADTRAHILHHAQTAPQRFRDDEITIIRRAIAYCQRKLQDSDTTPAEREAYQQQLEQCERRLWRV